MSINPINSSCRSNALRQSFGAKLSENTKNQFRKSGCYYLVHYGENSDRFKEFKECVSSIKEILPDVEIDLNVYNSKIGRLNLDVKFPDGGKKCLSTYNTEVVNGWERFSLDNMKTIKSELECLETEMKQKEDPHHIDRILDSII